MRVKRQPKKKKKPPQGRTVSESEKGRRSVFQTKVGQSEGVTPSEASKYLRYHNIKPEWLHYLRPPLGLGLACPFIYVFATDDTIGVNCVDL